MGLKLELVKANEGDCLLLHYGEPDAPALSLVDGGPSPVYAKYLEERLGELRKELVPGDGPLPLELVMVSHIDGDHISGVMQLLQAIEIARDDHSKEPYEVGRLWHNAFKPLTGADDKSVEAARKARMDAVPEAAAIVATVPEGIDTAAIATKLGIPRNEKSNEGQLVLAGATRALPGGLKLTVVGPSTERVEALRQDWAEKVKVDADELVPASLQETVANLSSIIAVAELDGRRILLTGDGVAEDILTGLEQHGFLDDDGKAHFDVLKLPHHGDEGNVSEELFERVTADHYAGSGDGKNHNPGLGTLRMLADARGDDEYDIWLTFREGKERLGESIETFEREQKKAGRKSRLHFPEKGAASVTIDLG